MRDLFKRVLETPFFRNIFKLSVSSIVVMGLSIVTTPILARIFSPEAYGEWGVFSSVSMIISSFIFFSYENAIVRTDDKKELPSIFWLCVLSAAVVLLLTVVVFVVGAWSNIKFFVDYPSVTLLAIVLAVLALDVLFSHIANRYSKYNTMSIAGITLGVSQPATRIIFGLIPLKKGLIYGNILGQVAKFGYYLFFLRNILLSDFLKRVSLKDIKAVAVRYKKFPLYDAPARMIEYFIGNIVVIILSIFFELEEIGCFSMITQLVLAPITLMGSSMSTVYFKDLSIVVNDSEQVLQVTRRTARVCFLMAILSCVFFVLGGDRVLVLFLGDKWALAGEMSLCLSIFAIPVILSEPLMPIFKVLEKQNMRFWLNVANLVLTIGALLVGAYLIHNILVVLIIYSLCYAALRFVMFRYQIGLAKVPLLSFKKELIAIIVLYGCIAVRLFFILK